MPRLTDRFVHIGPGAAAVVQPPFEGMAWYAAYDDRHGMDGSEGRLVSMHEFAASWDSWEMHPAGEEVVICTAGGITLIQEYPDGRVETVCLGAGEYAINSPGVWHTADIDSSASVIFITAGEGTEHRARLA